jgi:primary-amine oxidase
MAKWWLRESWPRTTNTLFSLRIDPAIDGYNNSLVVKESHPKPIDDPTIHNPFGVGYTTKQTFLEKEGPLDVDVSKGRIFKILNENVTNPVTGGPVGYQLVPHASQMLLAHLALSTPNAPSSPTTRSG